MSQAAITPAAIAAAEALAGVAYTHGERALLLEVLADQRRRALLRRAAGVLAPPACRFDPRLPGWRTQTQAAFRPPALPAGPVPQDEASVAFASVAQLAGWIAGGQVSSEWLTGLYLRRIERLAPQLGCFATVTAELAMQQARDADAALAAGRHLGPLHGIPYGCKDIIDTAGIVTDWGAEPYRGRVPQHDAVVVRRLAEAGAVLLGKTSVGALAYGDLWHGGRTRNPWNVEQGSSGSSAGSASAVAAGLCGFALGTETLGSIVSPSVRCGATGLRPTFGRVARTGAMPLCWSLDKIGPIARGVADTALVLAALSGADAGDPSSIDMAFGWDADRPVAGLRLGYFPADLEADGAHALDRAALDAAAELGVTLVELERPDRPYDALYHVLNAEAAAAFEDLTLSDRDDLLAWQEALAWPNVFRAARFLSAVDHVQTDRLRREVMQDMDAAFTSVDAIIGPPLAGPMLLISNFTGHPCLILRSGFRAPDAPHAVCLWGRLFDEATPLSLGIALERRFGVWHLRPPGAA